MESEKLQLTQLDTQVLQVLSVLGEQINNVEGGELYDLISETVKNLFSDLNDSDKSEITITALEQIIGNQTANYENESCERLETVGALIQKGAYTRKSMAELFGIFRKTGTDNLPPIIIDIPPHKVA